MSRIVIYEVNVMFGDCDPAGIVFFPNFAKWMDASSLNFFMQCGVPPWRELVKTTGIIGDPLLEIQVRFLRPATYGETLQIHTSIQEWRNKAFLFRHVILRGEDVLCEGIETRAFCIHPPGERTASRPLRCLKKSRHYVCDLTPELCCLSPKVPRSRCCVESFNN